MTSLYQPFTLTCAPIVLQKKITFQTRNYDFLLKNELTALIFCLVHKTHLSFYKNAIKWNTILFSNPFSTSTRRPELVDYFSGSSPSSSNGCRLTKTELMLNNRLTPTSTSHSTTFHATSPHATTLHIDASNNVTVRALVYRAQSPDSPQGEDGELRNSLNL